MRTRPARSVSTFSHLPAGKEPLLRSRSRPCLRYAPVLRVNPVECQIERRIRLSGETQNLVGLVGPDEFTAVHLPSKSPRVTQPLSLCKIMPSPLQIGLGSF